LSAVNGPDEMGGLEGRVGQAQALSARDLAQITAGQPPWVSLRDILADLNAPPDYNWNWHHRAMPMAMVRVPGGRSPKPGVPHP